ncbi:MAG: alanine racemase [Oscillospiraceae bacterium]|nr:alanine racemase [Oscillospiraceae bacterium]
MNTMEFSNTYAKIDLDAIRENFAAIRQRANAPVMAVVKADAYGHGAVRVARVLEQECHFFGVSSVAEAVELRQAGIVKPILILGHVHPATFPAVVLHDIRIPLFNYEDACALSREALKQDKIARFHFAVDTGMSRIGFQATEESAELCVKIAALPGLKAEGLFSHFATADEKDLEKTKRQAELFAAFDDMLKVRGIRIPIRHLDNSAGIMNFRCHYEMVRAGIVLYGLYPSDEVDPKLLKLKPAMSWHSRVSYVKELEPGREISYGGTFKVEKPIRVATVTAGYADGYRRSLSGRFYVLIRGQRAPILGRVCMDQMLVDVTHIHDAQAGDEVVLLGSSGEETISAEAIAAAAGSFNYEQVCDLSHRVSRVYYLGGEKVDTVNYLLKR